MSERQKSFLDETAIFILDDQSFQILDANKQASRLYGYSSQELCTMRVSDLGIKKKRAEVVGDIDRHDRGDDRIWLHEKKNGEKFYVQFTYHKFNYQGRPAKFAAIHDVSEQINSKEKHRNKYPRLVDHSSNYPLAEIGFNADLKITRWSDQAEDLFGWSEEEVRNEGDIFKEIMPGKEYATLRGQLKKMVDQEKNHYTFEGKYCTKEGEIYFCKWYNALRYDEEGELISVYALVSDITDRKESQNLFRALSEESLVGVYLIQDHVFKYINPRFAEIFGYEKEEIEGHIGPLDLTYPDDREKVAENLRMRMNGHKKSMEYGFRCLTKDGRVIHVHVYGSAIQYAGSSAVVGTLVDITRNKKVLEQYQASVESFQDLFDSISDAIFIQGEGGRLLEVNKGVEQLYGYHRNELVGKSPALLSAKEKVDFDKIQEYSRKAINGESQHFKWWGKGKEGETFPLEVIINPAKYFGEDAMITIARDISERYKVEEQVRKNEEMFRQLFQNAPIAIALMDKDHMIQRVNESFTDIFGYTTSEVQGKDIDEVVVPEKEKSNAHKMSEKIFGGKTARTSGRRKCKDGTVVDTLIYGVPVILGGETIAIYGLYVDVTESKKSEQKIKQSLREKEVLLAEIHHRVKNNLAVITGLLELQSYNTNSEEASKVLSESQMRINSIALIHEKLYQRENLSEISFDTYLKQLIDVIVSSLQTNEKEVDIQIEADAIELTIGQAIPCGLILNELITNAYKHAFVSVEREARIFVRFYQEEELVTLVVRDNGTGLPDESDFENPTSLGIQLIKTLSAQLQGTARFHNVNPGTEFTLQFALEG